MYAVLLTLFLMSRLLWALWDPRDLPSEGLPGSFHHLCLQKKLLKGTVSGMLLVDFWGRVMKKAFIPMISGGQTSREA